MNGDTSRIIITGNEPVYDTTKIDESEKYLSLLRRARDTPLTAADLLKEIASRLRARGDLAGVVN